MTTEWFEWMEYKLNWYVCQIYLSSYLQCTEKKIILLITEIKNLATELKTKFGSQHSKNCRMIINGICLQYFSWRQITWVNSLPFIPFIRDKGKWKRNKFLTHSQNWLLVKKISFSPFYNSTNLVKKKHYIVNYTVNY